MQAVGINPDFWHGRRVFVTGHTGFMGGWLCLWLTRLGARVAGYSLAPPTRPNLFAALDLADDMDSMIGDVRDLELLSAAVSDFDPEIVLHLAAQPLVGQARKRPVETFDVNVMGTVNVLQAMRRASSVRAAVIVTTDKVYDNREWPWGYRETDQIGGREAYGASKACAELAVDAFRQSYFMPATGDAGPAVGIATARAGNIIGGGDWADDRLVPDAVRAFGANRPLVLRNPAALRPWQHVLDPLRGYLMLAERLHETPDSWQGAWNFGPAEGDATTVSMVADEMVRLWGGAARWEEENPDEPKPYEAGLLSLNGSKAAGALKWVPCWNITRALAATVEWYKAHLAQEDMRAFSLQQIAAVEGVN